MDFTLVVLYGFVSMKSQSDIQQLVDGFVTALSDLWRRQAVEALGGNARGGRPREAMRKHGAKRTAEELDRLCETLLGFVSKNPNLRIEQINKQLGTTTKELALPIRKLLADKRIKGKGQKRSTTYSAVK